MRDIYLEEDDRHIEYKYIYPQRGLVVDDKDPRDVGRIKVRVKGIYPDGIPVDDLPWAIPTTAVFRSGGDNSRTSMSDDAAIENGFASTGTGGIFSVPRVGNHVWVFFDQGNHMYPVYWAMAPGDSDWLTQKLQVKDRIDGKIEQIKEFREKFSPVDGQIGTDGVDWADGAHINARQNTVGTGQPAPYGSTSTKSTVDGQSQIKGGKYDPRLLHIDNKDANGDGTKNMFSAKERAFGNDISLDIKPLFDAEPNTGIINRAEGVSPHFLDPDGKIDEPVDTKRNINRHITSFTTVGGTTIIIDNSFISNI